MWARTWAGSKTTTESARTAFSRPASLIAAPFLFAAPVVSVAVALAAGVSHHSQLALRGHQPRVGAVEGHQLVVRADLADATLDQDHDAVGVAKGGEAVGD